MTKNCENNEDGVVRGRDGGWRRNRLVRAGTEGEGDGNGVVNVVDLGILRSLFFMPPGPSGAFDACTSIRIAQRKQIVGAVNVWFIARTRNVNHLHTQKTL